jgi:Tol biopolymer transport system component
MTRSQRDSRSAAAGPREPRTPRGSLLAGAPLAVLLSVVGLVVVALGTFALGSGDLPFSIGGGHNPGASGGAGNNGVARTPTPSNVVVVPTDVPAGIKVPGTLVYAKDGNIWLQSGGQASQLTSGGNDSMPSFTADGANVLFVRTRPVLGLWNVLGVPAGYAMDVPTVMEVPTAGGTPAALLDGLYNPPGNQKWMDWIREPALSPDGHTIAIVTDLPNPTKNDVVLKFWDLKSHRLSDPGLAEVSPLGHQNPAWRPDGKVLAYVYNNRDGANGTPQIYGYTVATKRAAPISGAGYLQPSWSPDGKYLAVTKTSAYGTDVAIINAATGAEVTLVTNDGSSWAPAWSPAGDQIAFLHLSGQVVDLRLVPLAGGYGDWTPGPAVDLTQNAGLDSISRPDWFVPADQIPAATPVPGASSAGGSSPAPSGSAAPSPS